MTSLAGSDWLASSIEEVDRARHDARGALDAALDVLRPARAEHERGAPLAEIVDGLIGAGARDLRLRSMEALNAYEGTVMRLRGRCVRSLVDDERRSLADVARQAQISRQLAARLYRATNDEGASDRHHP